MAGRRAGGGGSEGEGNEGKQNSEQGGSLEETVLNMKHIVIEQLMVVLEVLVDMAAEVENEKKKVVASLSALPGWKTSSQTKRILSGFLP